MVVCFTMSAAVNILLFHAGPASPEAPMNLMIMSSFSDRVTIQWTVPVIAYTPETYVVMFGLSMSSLNMMSPMVQSGDDFETTNQVLSVEVTGLTDTTTYHYRVVATNGQGSTSSGLQSFMTTILRKLYTVGKCYNHNLPKVVLSDTLMYMMTIYSKTGSSTACVSIAVLYIAGYMCELEYSN